MGDPLWLIMYVLPYDDVFSIDFIAPVASEAAGSSPVTPATSAFNRTPHPTTIW